MAQMELRVHPVLTEMMEHLVQVEWMVLQVQVEYLVSMGLQVLQVLQVQMEPLEVQV